MTDKLREHLYPYSYTPDIAHSFIIQKATTISAQLENIFFIILFLKKNRK